MPRVTLQGSDNRSFKVDIQVAKMFGIVKAMLDDDPKAAKNTISLERVHGDILKLVVRWAEQHQNDPPVPEDEESRNKLTEEIGQWDKEFLRVDQTVLLNLIMAAEYLDVKGLLDLTCRSLANIIKGKSPEEIRRTFNIRNDFTPADIERIKKENGYCEDK